MALVRVSTLMVTLALVSGCATVDIQRAQDLAKAGATSSESLVTYSSNLTTAFKAERASEDINDALLGAGTTTPSPAYQSVLKDLDARHTVAVKLQAAYAAFQTYAGYDSSGEFHTAAGGLLDAVNSFSHVVGAATVSPLASSVIDDVGGEVLKFDQASVLKKQSKVIQTILIAYGKILDSDQDAYISITNHEITAHYQTIQTLWDNGFLEGSKLFGAFEPEDGLTAAGKPESYTHTNAKVDTVVKNVLAQRKSIALDAVKSANDANRKLVTTLIQKHQDFQDGKPLNLDDLVTVANELEAATASLTSAPTTASAETTAK